MQRFSDPNELRKTVCFIVFIVAPILTALCAIALCMPISAPVFFLFLSCITVPIVLLIIWFAFNLIYKTTAEHKLTHTSARTLHDQLDKEREAIVADAEQYKCKLQKFLSVCKVIDVVLLVGAFLVIFGVDLIMAQLIIDSPADYRIILALTVGIDALLYLLFAYKPCKTIFFPDTSEEQMPASGEESLDRKEYPRLYGVANRAAEAVNFTGTFRLIRRLDLGGISVSENRDGVSVYLPPAILTILTETELYQVLLHEFMHVVNADTVFLTKINDAKSRYQLNNFLQTLYYGYVSVVLERQSAFYLVYASHLHEINADKSIALHGDAQTFINATAKAILFDKLVLIPPRRELVYDFYESETVPTDFFEQAVNVFEKGLPSRLEEEKEIMFRTLPTKQDSHPTFRMRANAMNVTDFNPFERSPQGPYQSETIAYCRACSRSFAELYTKEEWQKARKEYYLDVKERIEAFEQSEAEADEDRLFQLLRDYSVVDRKKALALADKILSENPDLVYVRYMRGYLLCTENRDGTEDLFAASEQSVDAFSASTDTLANYIFSTGDEERIEAYRSKQTQLVQIGMDAIRRKQSYRPSSNQLLPCDLPRERIDAIAKVAQRIGKDCFLQANLVATSVGKEGDKVYAVIVRTPSTAQYAEKSYIASEQLNSYLATISTNTTLFLFYHNNRVDSHTEASKKVGIDLLS